VFLFRVQKVKVTRLTNAEIESASYLPKGISKNFKLGRRWTWSTKTCINDNAMTSRVKGQGRMVTWSVSQLLAHKSRTKSPRNTKLYRRSPMLCAIKRVSDNVTKPINAESKSVSYLPNGDSYFSLELRPSF